MSGSPLPCPPPTFLVALLLPLWGWPCIYVGTFFWNLECLGCFKGEGPMCLLHRISARGHPGPRQTIPVTVNQKDGVPLCRVWTSQTHLG